MKHQVITIPAAPAAPEERGDHRPARRLPEPAAKLIFAALVFVLTIAGWWLVERYKDRHSPLPNAGTVAEPCALWFVGSSSMHKWTTLHDDMLPWETHNRGVDGAQLSYLVDRFASDEGAPLPRAIVLYGGENDIAKGGSAADALASFERLLIVKREKYGALPVFVVSVKPSPTRWRFLPEQTRLNRGLAALARQSRDIHYVDIVPLMLVNRRPGPFYQPDGIHLNHVGYQRWGGAVRRAIAADLPSDVVRRCAGSGRRS